MKRASLAFSPAGMRERVVQSSYSCVLRKNSMFSTSRPACIKKRAPFLGSTRAAMRWITPLFDGIIKGVKFLVIWSHAIDQQVEPASFQHTRHLFDGLRNVGKVVRGDATGDAVEAGAGKGKLLGVRHLKLGIGDTLSEQEFA